MEVRNPTSLPDVIILEHDHTLKVEPMQIHPTDELAVLLNESKAYKIKECRTHARRRVPYTHQALSCMCPQ